MLLTCTNNHTAIAAAARARLTIPALFENRRCLTLNRLIEESERQLEQVARRGAAEDMQVAQRILECPMVFLRWEHEYTVIMSSVASASCVQEQKRMLLSASLSLLHRKGLFEYLRDHRVHDHQRELLLMHFHGGHSYARGMVIEHGNYLRSAASYLCATFLGLRLMHESLFARPLDEYEALYARYFAAYSKRLFNQSGSASHSGKLAYKLKCELGQRRKCLLNGVHALH